MFYVYLIKSISFPKQKYIGYTQNLDERLKKHNHGGSPHTSSYKPWELKVSLGFQSQDEAIAFERYLKSGAGRAFVKKRL